MSENATSRSVAQGMARLKELLFDSEVETLGELDKRLGSIEQTNHQQERQNLETLQRVDQLFKRAGTEERFRDSVAVVLDKALAEAELRNHDQMSRALAPLVVNTIKTELKNSQDELVDIMFPITGRMVKSYLAAEMKKLSESVNNRIDHNPIMLRLRALTSGKKVRDLAIAETQRLSVDEVFLIRRGSGELLAHWPQSATAMSNADVHLSGVLSAINDFASSAFDNDGGHFQSFRYENVDVHMRASPVYLLAAKCSGIAPSGIEPIFDEAFLETLERVTALERAAAANDRDVTAQTRSLELHPLTEHVESKTTEIYEELANSSIGGAVVKVLLFLIAVPLLAWFFWGLYTDAEEAVVRRSANHVITSTPELKGYQTQLDVGYRGRSIKVTGLVPDEAVGTGLTAALSRELPSTTINAELATVPKARTEVVREIAAPPPAFDSSALEKRFADRLSGMESQLVAASAQRAIARADRRLRLAVPAIDRLESQIDGPARQADIREVRTAVEKTLKDVAALRKQLTAAGRDQDALSQLIAPINETTSAVGREITSLASLHGAGAKLGAAQKPAATNLVDAAEDLTSQAERIATLAIALHQSAAMIPEPVVVPPPRTATPEEKLRTFAQRHAIFFSTGVEFLSAQRSKQALDELAGLIKASSLLVRVVGYTDERGQSNQNDELALSRANAVMAELVRRGVDQKYLVAIGRPGGNSLSPGAGAASPNRRVQFEVGFLGEVRNPP